jgi:hypothetical protein
MFRSGFIALVLAALTLPSAAGSPSHTVKPHKNVPAASFKSHAKSAHQAAQGSLRKQARPAASATHAGSGKGQRLRNRRTAPAHAAHRIRERQAVPVKARLSLPPPLFGSRASLERQNTRTEADNLERIEDDDDLADRIAHGLLVPVPVSATLTINQSLPAQRRYCRPWTATFLADLARAHGAAFHKPLYVSSAVRTVAYQKQLMETNGNAAAAEGDIASPHLTGATVDLAKQGLSRQELGWLRGWLLPLQVVGKIDVEEEFRQTCFHITVYKSYVPARAPSATRQAKSTPRQPGRDVSRTQVPAGLTAARGR